MDTLWQAVADMQADQKVFNDPRDTVGPYLQQEQVDPFYND